MKSQTEVELQLHLLSILALDALSNQLHSSAVLPTGRRLHTYVLCAVWLRPNEKGKVHPNSGHEGPAEEEK